jgi:hypothetical protein
MNRINFSHVYPKLHEQVAAQLLKVEVHDRKELNEEFVMYDTVYRERVFRHIEGHGDVEYSPTTKYYPLPSGKLIVLVFLGDKLIPFTTVRRWTPMKNADGLNKEEWYRSHIGELFEIVTKETK